MGTLDEVEKQNVLDIIHRNIFSQEEIDSVVSDDALTLLNFSRITEKTLSRQAQSSTS